VPPAACAYPVNIQPPECFGFGASKHLANGLGDLAAGTAQVGLIHTPRIVLRKSWTNQLQLATRQINNAAAAATTTGSACYVLPGYPPIPAQPVSQAAESQIADVNTPLVMYVRSPT
jgi:hypothetical protein